MKIGCCANMLSTRADGIGGEWIPDIARLGFDYVELPLAQVSALSDGAFDALRGAVEASGIRCETCNNFFPACLRLTGRDVDAPRIGAYAEEALRRAAALGAELVVFGSGPARNVPDGFPLEQGYRQVVELLRQISPLAEAYGIGIAVEPLRRVESNLIHTFSEGVRLAEEVDRANVRMLADYYHMREENDTPRSILDHGRAYLRHVHFARARGRRYPRSVGEDETDRPFLDTLKAIEYDRRISIEAYTEDFPAEGLAALRMLRQYLG